MLFRAHGRFCDSLGGRYVDGRRRRYDGRRHGLRAHGNEVRGAGIGSKSGDPSSCHGARCVSCDAGQRRCTSGVAARRSRGRTVAIQGLRHVGAHLATRTACGAARKLIVALTSMRHAFSRVVDATLAQKPWHSNEIYGARPTSLRPARLGGIMNDDTIAASSKSRLWPARPTINCSRIAAW